jgi:hypothetical protein
MLLVATFGFLLSCSDGGSTGTTSGATSTGNGSVSLDASKIFKGTLTLSGTITLPPGTGAGKSIQLTASGGGDDITKNGSQVGSAGSSPGDSVPYTITGLSEGKYSVRARIDIDGNGVLGSGDLDGFTGGTVDAPITDFAKAKEFDVGPSGATGVDFGVAKVP